MTRKNSLRYTVSALALAGMVGIGGFALAQAVDGNPATLGTNAPVTIIAALGITQDFPLNFGTLTSPTTTATSFTIATAGDSITSQSGGNGTVIGTDASNGNFTVTGDGGRSYTWAADASSGSCPADGTGTGGLILSVEASASGTLNDNPTVGGTLTVPVGITAAGYTCTYTVTASY